MRGLILLFLGGKVWPPTANPNPNPTLTLALVRTLTLALALALALPPDPPLPGRQGDRGLIASRHSNPGSSPSRGPTPTPSRGPTPNPCQLYAIAFYHAMEFTSASPPPDLALYWGAEAPYPLSYPVSPSAASA